MIFTQSSPHPAKGRVDLIGPCDFVPSPPKNCRADASITMRFPRQFFGGEGWAQIPPHFRLGFLKQTFHCHCFSFCKSCQRRVTFAPRLSACGKLEPLREINRLSFGVAEKQHSFSRLRSMVVFSIRKEASGGVTGRCHETSSGNKGQTSTNWKGSGHGQC